MKYLLILFMLVSFAAPSWAAGLYWDFSSTRYAECPDCTVKFTLYKRASDNDTWIEWGTTFDLKKDIPTDMEYPVYFSVTAKWLWDDKEWDDSGDMWRESVKSEHVLYLPEAPQALVDVKLSLTPTDTTPPKEPDGLKAFIVEDTLAYNWSGEGH